MSHVIMKKKLAHALMDAGMENYAGGGLIGGLSDALGANNNFQAQSAGNTSAQVQQQYGQQQDIYGQQQALASQLLAQTQGQGPGQQLIQQQAGQLGAQQGAIMASARGASSNPALVARQAAMAGAQGQQQALNSQAALQLQSQNALSQQYGQMAGQTLQGQSIGQGAIAAQNQVNAGVAGQNASTNKGIAGGILGAIGGGLFAHGGEIPKMATGGMAPLMGIQQYGGAVATPAADNSFGDAFAGGMKAGHGLKDYLARGKIATPETPQLQMPELGASAVPTMPVAGIGSPGAFGANQSLSSDPMLNPMQPIPVAQPSALAMPAFGAMSQGGQISFNQMLAGGSVPGKAEVEGDSEKNDTEPTLLSPGEIVLPRSIAQHPDAPEKAAEFIRHLRSKKKKMSYGGVVEARKAKGC